jgi:hypothetical protein
MPHNIVPVKDDEQKPRADQRREERNHAKIPDVRGRDAADARRSLRKHQAKQKADRSHRSVAGDEKRSDFEEDGMHLREEYGNTAELAGLHK